MIVEIKILCECGTKYKFDVEPLEGRLPSRVHCPGCGAEDTDTANAQLRQKLAPPPALPTKTAPLPNPAASSTASAAPSGAGALPFLVEPKPISSELSRGDIPGDAFRAGRGRFAWGVAGALMAGLVATFLWYGLVTVTGYQIGFAAWGIGLLVGSSARWLGRVGSSRLGWVAACCAFAAIAIGQWLSLQVQGHLSGTLLGRSSGAQAMTLLWLLLAAASAWKLGNRGASPQVRRPQAFSPSP